MNAAYRQYLFGLLFITFGFYELYKQQQLEFALYTLAGLSFVFNQLVSEPRVSAYRKPLAVITWGLIIATGLTFLYLLQFKFS